MARHPNLAGIALICFAMACSKSSTPTDAGIELADADAPDAIADVPASKDVAAPEVTRPDTSPDAPPFLSDPGAGAITSLQIRGTTLYWIGGYHRIVKASVDGTGATNLFTASGNNNTVAIEEIAIDDSAVYYAYAGDRDYANRGVYKLPLAGDGAPVRLTSTVNPNTNIPNAIAASGDDIFYAESSAIRRVKTSGGAVTTMVENRGAPNDSRLVVKDGYVYFTMLVSSSGRDDLYRLPVDAAVPAPVDGGVADGGAAGSVPEKVSLVPGNMSIDMAKGVDQGFVYWGVYNTVYRTDGINPPTELFTAGSSLQPSETGLGGYLLAYDGTLYWSKAGRMFKQAVGSPGTGTAFANLTAGDMVADSTYLYVVTNKSITRIVR